MSFLELKPAARRLRQVAKAHAAGEIPRQDYRRTRREIIEELHVDFSIGNHGEASGIDRFRLGEDDTLPRFTDRPRANTKAQVRSRKSVAHRAKTLRIIVVVFACLSLLGALVGGFSAFAASIPSVSKRDPNPKNSPTFPLRSLAVTDFVELPGITRDEVDGLLDELLVAARKESGAEEGGTLTSGELAEFGELLQRLGVHDEQGLDERAVDALNSLARRQRSRRGVSVVQLERIAEDLERFYRARGYLAARAFVPSQNISDDHAVLRVLPGRLSAVTITNRSSLSLVAEQALSEQLGSVANRSSLESVFYKLNNLPGVRASGNLAPGNVIGDTILNLSLENDRALVSSFSLDNFGDERSSRYRLKAHTQWLNPLGRGDELVFDAALKADPETATDIGLSYTLPGRKLGDTYSMSASRSNFGVEPRFVDGSIDGDATTVSAGIERLLVGSRTQSLAASVEGALQGLEFGRTEQRLWWLRPELNGHRVFDNSRWVLRGGVSLAAGQITKGRYTGQSAEFISGGAWVSAWRPIGQQSLRLELSTQIGSKDLPDSHKFRLGGPQRVSGIRPGSFVADTGVMAGVEISATPAAWRQYGQLEFFSRIGQGQVEVSSDRESAFAWDGGLLWRLPLDNRINGSLRLSVPLITSGIEDSHDRARVLFDVSWRP